MTDQEKAAQAAMVAEARAAGVTEGRTAAEADAKTKAAATPPKMETVDVAAAAKAAVESDRKRVVAIQSCEAAKGKPILASHLALETDMSVEQATSLLAKAGVEAPSKPVNQFADAMAALGNPKVGAGAGDKDGDGAPKPRANKAKTIDQYRGPAALRVAK